MLMSQFLKSRKTVRDYKKKALLPAAEETIRALIDEKNERLKPHHAQLAFFRDGADIKRVLEDKGGSSQKCNSARARRNDSPAPQKPMVPLLRAAPHARGHKVQEFNSGA